MPRTESPYYPPEIEQCFDLLRTFLNNHADAGESTWEQSEALEAIYEHFNRAAR